jgi:integrase
MTASEYFRAWLRDKAPDLERSTYEAYTIYIERHIAPFFEGKELAELRPLDIRAYVTFKRTGGREDGKAGGLSPVSVRKHLNVMKQALREAVLYELIPASPAEPVKVPRSDTAARVAPYITVSDCRKILQSLEGHPLRPMVLVTLFYGLRRSEALGLKWSAVDFERGEVYIRHTVVKNLTTVAKDRTKTASSRRTFPLLPEVADELRKLWQLRPPGREYVFGWEDGRPFRPDYVTRALQRALRRAGLPVIRFHDLRHATATILFDRGWSVPDVQHWLGHSDIDTTMNIYVSYSRSRPVALGGTLAGLFTDSPAPPAPGI